MHAKPTDKYTTNYTLQWLVIQTTILLSQWSRAYTRIQYIPVRRPVVHTHRSKERVHSIHHSLNKKSDVPFPSGQFITNPQPELFRPFWGSDSLTKPPFGVTTRRFGRYKLPKFPGLTGWLSAETWSWFVKNTYTPGSTNIAGWKMGAPDWRCISF